MLLQNYKKYSTTHILVGEIFELSPINQKGGSFGMEGVYACLFTKCFIVVRVDATHQSSTTTSSTPSGPNFSVHKLRHRYQAGPGRVG